MTGDPWRPPASSPARSDSRSAACVGAAGLCVLVLGLLAVLTGAAETKDRAAGPAPRTVAPPTVVPPTVVPPLSGPAVVVPPQASRATRLDGRARSVELRSAQVAAPRRVTLRGQLSLSAYGDRLLDAAGRSLGAGSVSASGAVVLAASNGVELDVSTLLVRPHAVEIPQAATPFDGEITARATTLRVSAAGLTFTPARSGASPRPLPGGTVTIPDQSEVSVRPSGRVVWADAPPVLSVRGRSGGRMSWAGSGSAQPPGARPLRGQYVGVTSDQLAVRLVRSASAVQVAGSASPATQVYTDGSPRLGTTASVRVFDDLLRVDRTDGDDDRFTWAPRNTGAVDMLITRVRPLNPPGRWVQLRLAPVPPAFGGEKRAPVGGDTSELGKGTSCFLFCTGAKAIRSELQPGDADRRDLTVTPPADIPAGRYTVQLRVEGNFPPVTVRVAVQIEP